MFFHAKNHRELNDDAKLTHETRFATNVLFQFDTIIYRDSVLMDLAELSRLNRSKRHHENGKILIKKKKGKILGIHFCKIETKI